MRRKRKRNWKKAIKEQLVLSIPLWIVIAFFAYWLAVGYKI